MTPETHEVELDVTVEILDPSISAQRVIEKLDDAFERIDLAGTGELDGIGSIKVELMRDSRHDEDQAHDARQAGDEPYVSGPAALDALATALTADTIDHVEVFEALKPLLTEAAFKGLGAAIELCPVHCCDIRICLDDEVHGEEVYST